MISHNSINFEEEIKHIFLSQMMILMLGFGL